MTKMYTPSAPRDNSPKKIICCYLLVQLFMQKWFETLNSMIIYSPSYTITFGRSLQRDPNLNFHHPEPPYVT